jgi:hypothetical protein
MLQLILMLNGSIGQPGIIIVTAQQLDENATDCLTISEIACGDASGTEFEFSK